MADRLAAVERINDGAAVRVTFGDGRQVRYHAIWLRDNALDAGTRDPGNGQRLIAIADIPADTRIRHAGIGANGALDLVFAPDGHTTTFPADWLGRHRYDQSPARDRGWIDYGLHLWSGDHEPARHRWPALASDRTALLAMLDALATRGLAIITDAPTVPGTVCEIAGLFGPVRETNYGRHFDVRSEVKPVNLAYSGLGLQAHTDNPYRDPLPTVQILHCLENSVAGGDSSVVDGFAVVKRLRETDRESFDFLSGYPARFRFNGDGISDLTAKRPMIELGPDGEVLAVRFNNRSAAPLVDIPYEEMAGYYRAYRRFADLVDDPEMAVSFRLTPGMAFLVDNRRVMHARTAFSGTGERWLQGCYADMDAVRSRRRVLRASMTNS
ncbi:TauD/TfdA family dioxygenase [Minwuia sp.]|uniref:2-trimethylaminoethylphosphonate dioxygenase n=1 Tax=Minwuia sp. TaxID=2493630 RepID=UPI003A91EAC6